MHLRLGQGDQESINKSINPVDSSVGIPQKSMKAQDGQPERREDPNRAVETTISYSNFPDLRKRLQAFLPHQ
jgi:hypothetical protein